jgi:hypothetical protein
MNMKKVYLHFMFQIFTPATPLSTLLQLWITLHYNSLLLVTQIHSLMETEASISVHCDN